jgi:GntR family transcriptional repressor for pyruvate dehydrogenase complex
MNNIDYTITKTNLYEQIADALEQAIIRSINDIEKLPSEQELSKRFNVSRTVIREALKVLKERGLIQSRNGEGSYVVVPKTDTISDALDRIIQIKNISNDNLHHTRLVLEIAGVRLAAVNIKPEELDNLKDILQRMSDLSLPLDERIRLDMEFHLAIARAGQNELLEIFAEVMLLLLKDYMAKGIFGPEGMVSTRNQHQKILDALKIHDPEKSEKALRHHLSASRKNVEKYEEGIRNTTS